MDISFNNIKELYDRVTPALKSKVKELRKNGIDYIKEQDIWNYLIISKWKNDSGLVLADIVDDILNTSNELIENYVKQEMYKKETETNLNFEIL